MGEEPYPVISLICSLKIAKNISLYSSITLKDRNVSEYFSEYLIKA